MAAAERNRPLSESRRFREKEERRESSCLFLPTFGFGWMDCPYDLGKDEKSAVDEMMIIDIIMM